MVASAPASLDKRDRALDNPLVSLFLITGGAGFIGSHLSLALARAGHRVRVLDNFSTSSRAAFDDLVHSSGLDIEVHEADIRDHSACRHAVREAEYILHHAGMASVAASVARPDECMDINVNGTAKLLMAARDSESIRRLVLASSSAVYGDTPNPRKQETDTLDPLSPYATSKLTGELLCRNFQQLHGLPTVALRYFNVYGPRQDPNGPYAAVIPKFFDAIEQGQPPVIYGDGEQSRDFVSVTDVVRANILACEAPQSTVTGCAFNVASGHATSLNTLIIEMSRVVERTIVPTYVDSRAGDIERSCADPLFAAQCLKFTARIDLLEGLHGIAASRHRK